MNPATLQELKNAIPDATADFLLEQLEDEATVTEAAQAWSEKLAAENAALRREVARQQAQRPAPRPADQPRRGQSARAEYDGDAVLDFDDAVRRQMAFLPHRTRQECVLAAARSNPRLHQAFLLSTNPSRRQKRLLEEKFGDLED